MGVLTALIGAYAAGVELGSFKTTERIEKMKKVISIFLACLTVFALSISASAQAACEYEYVDVANVVGFEELVLVDETPSLYSVEFIMAQTEPLCSTAGGAQTGAYAYYNTVVDNCADADGNIFMYVGSTLWRRIEVKEGRYNGYVGWVPNASVTSRNV